MTRFMVRPKDIAESLLIQEAAFAAGYSFISGRPTALKYFTRWLTFRLEEKRISYASSDYFPHMVAFTELSVTEILRMLGARPGIDCTIPEGS